MKTMWLWVPTDQSKWGKPRILEVGANPPQPGAVFEVEAKNRVDAMRAVALACQPEPSQEDDAEWLAWRKASKRVKRIDNIKSAAEWAAEE